MNSFCHHTATVGKKVVAPWLLLRPTYCISTKIGESLVKEVSREFFSTSTEERKYVKAICQLFFHKHYSKGITLLCTTYATVIHHPPRPGWSVAWKVFNFRSIEWLCCTVLKVLPHCIPFSLYLAGLRKWSGSKKVGWKRSSTTIALHWYSRGDRQRKRRRG